MRTIPHLEVSAHLLVSPILCHPPPRTLLTSLCEGTEECFFASKSINLCCFDELEYTKSSVPLLTPLMPRLASLLCLDVSQVMRCCWQVRFVKTMLSTSATIECNTISCHLVVQKPHPCLLADTARGGGVYVCVRACVCAHVCGDAGAMRCSNLSTGPHRSSVV